MAEVKWIKIVPNVFDDDKIKLIETMPDGDSIIVIWFKLLCLAGKQNRDGFLMLNDKLAYTEEMLSTIFRRPINTVRLALNTFEQFDMIEIIKGAIYVTNWDKHQNVDKLAELREYNRIAQQKSRDKKRLLSAVNDNVNDVSMTSQECQDTDIDKEEDLEIEKENKSVNSGKSTRFTPPTLADVQAYCTERCNNIDAERFIDFYTCKNWMVGKNKMKDWKAAVRNWERTEPKKSESSFDLDEFFEMAVNSSYGG